MGRVSLILVLLSTVIISCYLCMIAVSDKEYFPVFNIVGLAFASFPRILAAYFSH